MNRRRLLFTILTSNLLVLLSVLLLQVLSEAALPQERSAAFAALETRGSQSIKTAAINADLFPNCRYGVAAVSDQMQQFDIVSHLGTGWYLDFAARPAPPGPSEAEYAWMVRLHQGQSMRGGSDTCGPDYSYTVTPSLTESDLGAMVDANPGVLWIVGNEPDRKTVQDDICPQQYAEAYHQVYNFIKDRDPTAQIATAGLVEVTPGRLQYLDIVWDTYLEKYGTPMPVDVWTMHLYILSETGEGDANIALGTDPSIAIPHSSNCADPNSFCYAEHDDIDLFAEQVVQMREWMSRHGQQNKPLLITEYSILLPYNYYGICTVETCSSGGTPGCFCDENKETFHPRRVADFMEATFDYLTTATDPALGYPPDGYRLVQQWLWYSLETDDVGHASNLVESSTTYTLTLPGQRWHNYVAAISPTVNLTPAYVPVVVGSAANGADPVTVTLVAQVWNNGNIALTETVTATFYSNQALTMPIGSATFSLPAGCARQSRVVTMTWTNLNTGAHDFWVKVDSPDEVTESNETDNVGRGMALINPYSVFLPVIARNK